MFTTIIIVRILAIKHSKNNTNLKNPEYKSNLNNDNDNNVDIDNSENNSENKKSAFILGDSIVKNRNAFLIRKAISHKCIVKVQPFSSAKVLCMYDHVKPATREVNPDNIILHVGTND